MGLPLILPDETFLPTVLVPALLPHLNVAKQTMINVLKVRATCMITPFTNMFKLDE